MATSSRTTQRATNASSRSFSRQRPAQKPEMIKTTEAQRPFRRINLYMMGGCVALIVIGFLLMLGPGSSVEEGFNPDIFSTRRIAVGPALTFLGFLLMAFAIIWTPSRNEVNDPENSDPEV